MLLLAELVGKLSIALREAWPLTSPSGMLPLDL